jgi:hypothetical protein
VLPLRQLDLLQLLAVLGEYGGAGELFQLECLQKLLVSDALILISHVSTLSTVFRSVRIDQLIQSIATMSQSATHLCLQLIIHLFGYFQAGPVDYFTLALVVFEKLLHLLVFPP